MGYLESASSLPALPDSRLDRLLRKINEETNLPTLGIAIAKVVEITSSCEDSVAQLAHFVLSDVGLTQKILRLSNTVQYRTSSTAAVTTISRSIFLLGFNTVKTSAMAMLLVDFFKDKTQAVSVRKELVRSLCASIIGREMSQKGRFQNSEEAAIAALFKNVGRVLVASYDHLLYTQIERICDATESSYVDAAQMLLGCSFERFGEMALQSWNIPDAIVQAIAPLPNGDLQKTPLRNDWLKQVASFSDALAEIVMIGQHNAPGRIDAILQKYGQVLEIDKKALSTMLVKIEAETRQFAKSMNIMLPHGLSDTEQLKNSSGVPSEFLLKTIDPIPEQNANRYASGKPYNARDLLLAGMQDVTQMLASEDLQLNDLILLVLETLYSSMGFRFATVCLRDVTSGRYTSRIAVGENYASRQKGFNFTVKSEADLFHLAMSNNVDVMISDASVPKIRNLLPLWYQEILPDAGSFMILPLVVQKKPLGFFYADRAVAEEDGVSAEETTMIKTLKSQLLTAMMRGTKIAAHV
ncbi:HDOD domain-containing protein [Undibacterium jejuense]|uniref:HDOD domain-containing protein n=1 Tax=Undibacterium jejuense TaxID=1344949 RepID=A0A923HQC2_9BURK|nr:HDOD domain-containing protein [Undibacterium jejuense]MBC3863766.1 HDOD domain-containing protein [Undibacterium jejuense]